MRRRDQAGCPRHRLERLRRARAGAARRRRRARARPCAPQPCRATPATGVTPGAPVPRRLQVRDELLLRQLQRLVRLHRHLDLHRIVAPQRVPFPILGHQDPPEVGVAVEHDAEQIEELALRPVRRRPDARHASARGPRRRDAHLHAQPLRRRRRTRSRPGRRGCRPPRSAACAAGSRRPTMSSRSTNRRLGIVPQNPRRCRRGARQSRRWSASRRATVTAS